LASPLLVLFFPLWTENFSKLFALPSLLTAQKPILGIQELEGKKSVYSRNTMQKMEGVIPIPQPKTILGNLGLWKGFYSKGKEEQEGKGQEDSVLN
jgi:hypothetical protein